MRICIVIHTNSYGGSVKVAYFVYELLKRAKYEVEVLNITSVDDGFFNAVPHTNLNVSLNGFIKNSFFAFKRYFKKNKFDLIIGFGAFGNYTLALAELKTKLIISEHGNHTNNSNLISRIFVALSYKRADFITFLTKFDYDFYAIKKSIIIKNPFFMFDEIKNIPKENIVLFPSAINENKRLDFLIKAFGRLPQELKDSYKIVVAGDGVLRQSCEKLAKDEGIKLEIKGYIKDVATQYQRAKIVAMTSLSEGLSNVLIEAIFFDCARVGTNCIAGPSELIEDKKDGFLCDLYDVDEFSDRLKILMQDENLRSEICRNARLKKEEFLPQNLEKVWLDIVQKVLQKR